MRAGETKDTSLSLEQQQDAIKEWADKNGFALETTIRDHDFSGRSLNRPGLQELRDRARPDLTVIVWKYDRLARSVGGHSILVDELRDKGTDVVSVTEPGGKVPRQMLSIMAEYFSDQHSERITAVREQQANRGQFTGGDTPFGYRRKHSEMVIGKDGNPRERRSGPLVIDPEEAEIVREIYDRFIAGESSYTIAVDLEQRGVPRRGGYWHTYMVMSILRRPVYAGLTTHHRVIVAIGQHDPIVTRETWDAAQARLARVAVTRNKTPHNETSWLEGLLFHACGHRMYLTMVGSKTKKFPNFVCQHAQGPRRCGVPYISISRAKIEAMVRKQLVTDLKDIVDLDAAISKAEANAGGDDTAKRRAALEQQRERLERRHARARELWLDGGDSLDVWKETKAKHDAELSVIDEQIAALPSAPDPERYKQAREQLTSVRDVINLASDNALKTLLEQLGTVEFRGKAGVVICYHQPYADLIGSE